ncbi:hypothetical protein [Sporosarcina cascadiensis]|uniref:hypothetical protein n=1 Tax=Sporosarcina cascadiensis TaxID=2660747 RepID=UPI00129BB360|nr:hypothetical protein [Sporosarcina cascadiensis]
MKQTDNADDLLAFAESVQKGTVWIYQGNYAAEEPIMSDEDTAGREPLQVLDILIETDDGSRYFEFLFYSAAELEELTNELQPIYEKFPKEVLSSEAMKEKVRELKE